jgi:hypothetical protein
LPSLHAVPSAAGTLAQIPVPGLQPSAVHGSPSSHTTGAPAQPPLAHWSAVVQEFPSLHAVPSGAGTLPQVPVAGLQLSVVQTSPSSHTTAVPVQVPPTHWSAVVQRLPSLHAVPFATGMLPQAPVPGLQASVVQALPSSHATAVPVQLPLVHWSAVVQRFPSLHAVPFAAGTLVQVPVPGLQLSVVQGSASSQTTGVPAQVPATHWSPVVQRVPSVQAVPFATGVLAHAPVTGLQPSVVQALPSSQATAVPVQVPPAHWSAVVQRLPSLHAVPFAAGRLVQVPVPMLQASIVQALPSSQTTGVPVQAPFAHWSGVVQRLPSLHAVPFAAGTLPHVPVAGLQASVVQALPSSHPTAVPVQAPSRHWSAVVQRL